MKQVRTVFPLIAGLTACLLGWGKAANAATALAFSIQPNNAAAGVAFTRQPEVRAINADGSTDTAWSGDITVTATPVTGTPGGVVTGTATLSVSGGVATYSDLAISKAGLYYLTASATGLTSGKSSSFSIGGVTLTEVWSVQPDVNNDKTKTITGINQLRAIGVNHTPGHPYAGTLYVGRRYDTTATQQGGAADVFFWRGNHTLTASGPDWANPDGRFDMSALAAAGWNITGNVVWGVTVADDGYVYITNYNGGGIARFYPDGTKPAIVVAGTPTFRQIWARGAGLNTEIWAVEGNTSTPGVYRYTPTAVNEDGAPTAFTQTKVFSVDNGSSGANVNGQCVINNAHDTLYWTKGQTGTNKPGKSSLTGVVDTAFYANESDATATASGLAIDSRDRVLYSAAYIGPYAFVATDPVTGINITTNEVTAGGLNGLAPAVPTALNVAMYDFAELGRYSDRHIFYMYCNRGSAVAMGLVGTDVPAADPTNVLVDNPGTGNSLNISWTSAVDPEITGVNIYRSTTAGVLGSKVNGSPITGTSYTDSGLTTGVTYYYTVRSAAYDPLLNTAYEGNNTVQVAKTAALAGIPAAPSAIVAADTMVGGQVLVSWTNPAQYGEKINVYRSTASGTLGDKVKVVAPITNGAAASWTDTGLTNGTPYYYTVRAANGLDQESPNTDQVTATPSDRVAPTFAGVKAIAEYGYPGFRLSWNVAQDNSQPVTYKVYYATAPDKIDWNAPAGTTTDLRYDLRVPTLGQDMWFAVRAMDAAGNQDTNTVTLAGTPLKVIVDSDVTSPANNDKFNPHPDASRPSLLQVGIGNGKALASDLIDPGPVQGDYWFQTNDNLGKSQYQVTIPVAGNYDIAAIWSNNAAIQVPGYVWHLTYPNGSTEDISGEATDQVAANGNKWVLLKNKDLTAGTLTIVGDATASTDVDPTHWNVSGAVRATLHSAPKMVNVYKAAAAPTIDGNISNSEYAGVAPIVIGKRLQDVVGGPWNGPSDYSGNAYVTWDANALYIAYDVTDSTPFFPATADSALFLRDSLEIYLGVNNPQDPARVVYDDPGDYQIIVSADYDANSGVMTPKWYCSQVPFITGTPTNGEVAAKKTAKGYAFEVKIPWEELPFTTVAAGQVIGFNLSGNNTNSATSAGQDNAFVLSELGGSWNNPSHWVQATLLSTTPPAVKPGDVNQDGSVTLADAVAALKIAAGFTNAANASVSYNAGNVLNSGKIGIVEAVKIIRMANSR